MNCCAKIGYKLGVFFFNVENDVPTPIATFQNVYKTFVKEHQPVEVLRDCSFSIFEGQSISVVGKSGSGKSTFCKY